MTVKLRPCATTHLCGTPIALEVWSIIKTTDLVVKRDGGIPINEASRRRDESRHGWDVSKLVVS